MIHGPQNLMLAAMLGWMAHSTAMIAQDAHSKPAEHPSTAKQNPTHNDQAPSAASQEEKKTPTDEKKMSPGEKKRGETVRTPSQPTSDDILKAFQRDRPTNAPVRPRMTQDPGSPGDAAGKPGSLLREGESLYDAGARLVREGSWWTVVFESDSPDAPQPPMRVLPNQELERMVMESKSATSEPLFIVSGEVTLFESANYLLIRKALRSRATDNLQK